MEEKLLWRRLGCCWGSPEGLRDARNAPRGCCSRAGGGNSPARTPLELPPPPTRLNHPKKSRDGNGARAVSGASLAVTVGCSGPALSSIPGAGWSRHSETKDETPQGCSGFGTAAVLVLLPSWSPGSGTNRAGGRRCCWPCIPVSITRSPGSSAALGIVPPKPHTVEKVTIVQGSNNALQSLGLFVKRCPCPCS